MKKNLENLLNRALNRVDEELLTHLDLLMAQNEIDTVPGLLRKTSQSTRDAFWINHISPFDQEEPTLSEATWALLDRSVNTLASHLRRRALCYALRDTRVDTVVCLIQSGNVPLDYHSDHGPLAGLVYGDYPALERSQVVMLSKMMMDDGNMSCFNPSLIQYKEVLAHYIKLAPHPADKARWHAEFVWQPDHFTNTAVKMSCDARADPENVILLLEAGYPGIHIDLLARACVHQNFPIAHALLDWEDFHIQQETDTLKTAWDTVTEEPVLAEGFWHALTDAWATGVQSRIQSGWDREVPWPDDALIERLASIKELDPTQKDPEGRTPIDLVKERDFVVGTPPIESLISLREKITLDRATAGAVRAPVRSRRL